MKLLKTSAMISLYEKGVRKAKRFKKAPRQGFIRPLFTHKEKNGWYYQIDWENDKRIGGKRVMVYAFKPPRTFTADMADFYFTKE